MRHRSISDVDLSPDGSLVDYVVGEAVMDPSRSEYLSHVWVGATDGSWNVQYTRREKSSSLPLFSPDRQYLAFTSSRSGENQVWVMRVGGGEAEQITSAKSGFRFARGLVHTLRPGGVAYVVIGNSILQGVMIPTDIYLGKIAELAGL
jgi:Tol biopolymer transport system component